MGHPFVWLGGGFVGRVLGDTRSLDFARDDRFFSRSHAGEGARATWAGGSF